MWKNGKDWRTVSEYEFLSPITINCAVCYNIIGPLSVVHKIKNDFYYPTHVLQQVTKNCKEARCRCGQKIAKIVGPIATLVRKNIKLNYEINPANPKWTTSNKQNLKDRKVNTIIRTISVNIIIIIIKQHPQWNIR